MSDKGNLPTHDAFAVEGTKEEKNVQWTRIGAAFAHEDGKGYTINLRALPVNGRVVLREPRDDNDTRR